MFSTLQRLYENDRVSEFHQNDTFVSCWFPLILYETPQGSNYSGYTEIYFLPETLSSIRMYEEMKCFVVTFFCSS